MDIVLTIVRPYSQLIKYSFRLATTYRVAALAGMLTNLFFGLLRAAVMVALFDQQEQVAGMTLQDAITYTAISQASISCLNLFGWYGLLRSVHSGQIGAELLRPVGVFQYWIAQDFGRFLVAFIMRTLSLMAAFAVIFKISTPASITQWAAVLLALVLGWLVNFCFSFLANLPAFWTPNAIGFARLAFTLSMFLSGFLMPVRFFPDWFQRLVFLTPFPHTVNTIIEVYLGLLNPLETAQALLLQAAWVVILTAACLIIMRAGIRRLVILGG